ncbi:phosphatase [Methylonatrum kenyense]|uniref:metallophosphoesterase n=1 Tax=Methylonatrum kenyense TaxID=455253 RepID=UPI0020BF9BB8|nr:metallophosphoesterase [Methylonatrum kenyense]MCK8515863.1 phosphatase [Methylonatrum kenyense]
MSDLHLEFQGRGTFEVPALPGDTDSVLVLAGDIDVDTLATDLARRTADRFRAIIQIAGNHEYYKGGSPQRLPAKLRASFDGYENLHFLDDSVVDVDDVRFIGGTLWSDFNKGDEIAMQEAQLTMRDFRRIRVGTPRSPYRRKFTPRDAIALHTRTRRFIVTEIENAHALGLTPVVVTHHAPILPEGQDGSLISFAYGSDLTSEMTTTKPALWIHGHVHESMDCQIGNTRLVCNPRGYVPEEPNEVFDPLAVVDI